MAGKLKMQVYFCLTPLILLNGRDLEISSQRQAPCEAHEGFVTRGHAAVPALARF